MSSKSSVCYKTLQHSKCSPLLVVLLASPKPTYPRDRTLCELRHHIESFSTSLTSAAQVFNLGFLTSHAHILKVLTDPSNQVRIKVLEVCGITTKFLQGEQRKTKSFTFLTAELQW